MKRIFSLTLALIALMILVVPVAAGGKWVDAQQAPLYPVASGSSDYVLTAQPAQGKVIVVDPMGNVGMVIQGHASGLTPGDEYEVWVRDLKTYSGNYLYKYAPLGYFKLTSFVADQNGAGNFHLNLRLEDLNAGTYQIQVAINTNLTADPIEKTVLATQWPGLTVTVHSR